VSSLTPSSSAHSLILKCGMNRIIAPHLLQSPASDRERTGPGALELPVYGHHGVMPHQRHSIWPPRIVFIALFLILLMFVAVWGAVTAAVEYGSDYCPNRVGGTGASGCR
jgi:hypothetical protein